MHDIDVGRPRLTVNAVHLQLLLSVNLAFTSCSKRHAGLFDNQEGSYKQLCLQFQANQCPR